MSPGSMFSLPQKAILDLIESERPRMNIGRPRPMEIVLPSASKSPTVKSSASYIIVWYAVRIRLVFISPVIATIALRMTSAVKASTLFTRRLPCFFYYGLNDLNFLNDLNGLWSEPLSLDRFWGEFRMPSGRKKEVVDERAEKVFSGIQATGSWGVAWGRVYVSAAQSSARR